MIPLAEVAAHFRQAAREMRPALEATVHVLMEGAALTAREAIGREMETWDPLSARTIAEKMALGYTGQVSATDPLLRTGALRESISGDTDSHTYGGVLDEVVGIVGSTDPVSKDQELGTSRIPPRPFLAPALILAQPAIEKALGELAQRACIPGEVLL